MSLYSEIRESAKHFPYIQFILGAGFVFAVAAQVLSLKIDLAYTAVAGVLVLLMMFCLVLFRAVSSVPEDVLHAPVKVLVWFFTFTCMFVVTGALAYVGKKMLVDDQVATNAIDGTRSTATTAISPPSAKAPAPVAAPVTAPVAAASSPPDHKGTAASTTESKASSIGESLEKKAEVKATDRKSGSTNLTKASAPPPLRPAEKSPENPAPSERRATPASATPVGSNCREIAAMDFSKFPPEFSKSLRCD